MNPITTATIPTANDPALLLIQLAPGKPISYAAIHCDPAQAIDLLRRALIHLVAEQSGLATVPTHAAIAANGHSLEPAPDSSRVLVAAPVGDIPPLRVPKTKPAGAPTPLRGKPGPKPGARRRKIDVEDDE